MKHLIALAILSLAIPCEAANKVVAKKQVVVVQNYAIPVAVPVAPLATYYYSSSQVQQQAYSGPPRSAEDILVDRLVEKLSARIGGASLPAAQAIAKQTLFGQKCATCHAKGDLENGKPQFTTLEALTPQQRLNAIDAMVHDRMPKGSKLSAQDAGELIREIVSQPVKAQVVPPGDVPPPPPEPQPER